MLGKPAAKNHPASSSSGSHAANDSTATLPQKRRPLHPDGVVGADFEPESQTLIEHELPLLPKGIRLADNVKLPAVILAISAAEKDSKKKLPAPVVAAMHGIVDTFYQDLAANAVRGKRPASSADVPDTTAHPIEGGGGEVVSTTTISATTEPEAGDENTIVIHPGPIIDQARDRANETYRALFGDAAFDQMTMQALMESQLPIETAAGTN